jgi:hypothetical protein
MIQRINRIPPVGPVTAYKSYEIAAPRATHSRPATCAEVNCGAHIHGWATSLVPGSDDERFLRRVCRGEVDAHRRHFTEHPQPDGFVRFVFPPGQTCFAIRSHRLPVGRPEIFVVRDGDWRGNPTGTRRTHTRPEHWVEDFAEHQQRISDLRARG